MNEKAGGVEGTDVPVEKDGDGAARAPIGPGRCGAAGGGGRGPPFSRPSGETQPQCGPATRVVDTAPRATAHRQPPLLPRVDPLDSLPPTLARAHPTPGRLSPA